MRISIYNLQVLGTERLNHALDQATFDTMKEEDLIKKRKNLGNMDSSNAGDTSSDESVSLLTQGDFDEHKFKTIRKTHEERAKRLLLDMRSKLSDIMLRYFIEMNIKLVYRYLLVTCKKNNKHFMISEKFILLYNISDMFDIVSVQFKNFISNFYSIVY